MGSGTPFGNYTILVPDLRLTTVTVVTGNAGKAGGRAGRCTGPFRKLRAGTSARKKRGPQDDKSQGAESLARLGIPSAPLGAGSSTAWLARFRGPATSLRMTSRPDYSIWAVWQSHALLLYFSASRCITSKDKVGRFGFLVAGEAAFHKGRVAGFAVREVTEAPAAGCGVLF
jgi:hypothetical protein